MTVNPLMKMAAALTLLTACTNGPSGDDDGGTEVGDGDGDPTGDGDGDDPSGDGDPTGGDGDGDGDDPSGDGDPTGGECEAAGDSYAGFDVLGSTDDALDWDLLCSFEGVGPGIEGPEFVISLSNCASQNGGDDQTLVELMINSDPMTAPLPLAQPGDQFRLRLVEVPPFIAGRWFTLRSEPGGTLLLAGIYGPALLPPDAPDFDFAPLDIELVDVGCDPFEHPSQCGVAQPLGLEVAFDGDVVTVAHENHGYVGQLASYHVITGDLLDFPEVTCDDFPDQILHAVFIAIPEG